MNSQSLAERVDLVQQERYETSVSVDSCAEEVSRNVQEVWSSGRAGEVKIFGIKFIRDKCYESV